MHPTLLGLAAAAFIIPAAPVQAQDRGHTVHTGFPMAVAPAGDRAFHGDWRRGPRDGSRRDRRRARFGDSVLFGGWYGDQDFDGNRSFDPDRWNDWWHERPARAFPRWVQHNDNCPPERMWWAGGTLRC